MGLLMGWLQASLSPINTIKQPSVPKGWQDPEAHFYKMLVAQGKHLLHEILWYHSDSDLVRTAYNFRRKIDPHYIAELKCPVCDGHLKLMDPEHKSKNLVCTEDCDVWLIVP
jgi:hypothetical protein